MPASSDASFVRWQPPASSAASTFTEASLPPWELFLVRSGEEGERWVADYRAAGCDELNRRIEASVAAMRRQDLEGSRRELAAIWREIESTDPARPDIEAVICRWYFTAIAYHHYLRGDYSRAAADVERAQQSVEKAIELRRLLLPLAHQCIEFEILRARVAREQRCWDRMRLHVQHILGIADDLHPLCCVHGEPLYVTALDRYLLALPQLSSEEKHFLERLLDKQVRVERLGLFSRRLYALPDLLIPYP